ncbi:hypothetical protein DFJ67_3332 [Asanoa ferruginea]|uniref:Uncharacterized protein n=1 Tax=Asanoa ferruginea TaxID=53367 RepID=A0A3D9ZJ84_9ACTN|nr:hypothetical protein DFJ67_3332 [Asanoa ferruginea]
MRQLQFFTTKELAVMRDRTASRNYSAAGDEFRREHQRHRAWGLGQRHAERLRQLRGTDRDPRSPTVSGNHPGPAIPPVSEASTPPNQPPQATPSPNVVARQHRSRDAKAADQSGPPAKASLATKASTTLVGDSPSGLAEKTPTSPTKTTIGHLRAPAKGASQPSTKAFTEPTRSHSCARRETHHHGPQRPIHVPNKNCTGATFRRTHSRGPPERRSRPALQRPTTFAGTRQ